MGLRRLAISNPSANTDTTFFTSDGQYLVSVIAANTSTTTSANIRVWVQPSGSSSSSQYAYIVYDIPVDASNSYETFRFAINQNDIVKIRSTTANLSFQLYGLVQYDVNLGAGISTYSATAPISPVDGMIWVDSSSNVNGGKLIKVWSASSNSWLTVTTSAIDTSANYTFTGTVVVPGYEKSIPLQSTAPASPSSSDLWVDSTSMQLKVYSGTTWIALGAAVDESQLVLAQRMFG